MEIIDAMTYAAYKHLENLINDLHSRTSKRYIVKVSEVVGADAYKIILFEKRNIFVPNRRILEIFYKDNKIGVEVLDKSLSEDEVSSKVSLSDLASDLVDAKVKAHYTRQRM